MRIKVVLHGVFKDYIKDGEFFCDVKTAEEAIRALTNQVSQFQPDFRGRKIIKVKGIETEMQLSEELKTSELHVFPAFSVSKGNIFNIIVGTVLVVVGTVVSGMTFGGAAPLGSALSSIGISLILTGFMGLLFPQPKMDMGNDTGDPNASKYLGGPHNTTAIGTRIPIGYGLHKMYGHYISFALESVDVGA